MPSAPLAHSATPHFHSLNLSSIKSRTLEILTLQLTENDFKKSSIILKAMSRRVLTRSQVPACSYIAVKYRTSHVNKYFFFEVTLFINSISYYFTSILLHFTNATLGA